MALSVPAGKVSESSEDAIVESCADSRSPARASNRSASINGQEELARSVGWVDVTVLIPRNDLALGAMDERRQHPRPGPAAQHDRRAARLDGVLPAPARGGRGKPHAAHAAERLAQASV